MTQILLPKGALAASILHFPGLVITFTIAIPTSWQIITHMSEHLCVTVQRADNHFYFFTSSIKDYVLACQNGKGDC